MPDFTEPQDALVAVMIAVSAADEQMTSSEMTSIVSIIGLLPVFRGYDKARIEQVAATVDRLFEHEDGIDRLIARVRQVLPPPLVETAYALACDVAAADGRAADSELRLLQMLRQDLNLDRLTAAAIERGARARHRSL